MFRSALAARNRLLTLVILLVKPRLRLEFEGRILPWLSGVASMGLDVAAGTIDIRPQASFGVTGVFS